MMKKKKNVSDQGKIPLAMITTMKKLKSGYINGTRVSLGNLNDFLSTSCITNLSFLGSSEDGRPDQLNPQVRQVILPSSITINIIKIIILGTAIFGGTLDACISSSYRSVKPHSSA